MADYQAVAAARERECRIQARAYSIWLSALQPANIVLKVGAAVLSAVAGAAVLAGKAGNVPGCLALASAVFTVIHTRLDCDVHQAECRRLRSAYDAQAYRYRSLRDLGEPAELHGGVSELDTSLASIRAEAKANAPNWAVDRATRRELATAVIQP
ncbi:hypothetical protein [Nocardia bovistercoris]|uniref:Uncharacterized protein n=1 Tax=Nocardia bovistercoris TaxID=2785916 RepID=A0A931N322_9NOCA|nr:hypothetical protein [Nocardia bovistercoris]MBH0777307.1 hypothetical protein [Nocardia bovistercoris]